MPIEFISNFAQKNRSANVSSSAFFYLVDTANIDYRIKNIQENASLNPLPANTGDKYIIRNKASLHPGFTGTVGPITNLDNNDIIIYENTGFSLYVDVSNTSSNQGGIVYNDSDDKLYYYNGSIWRSLGLGSLTGTVNQIAVTGSTGDTKISLTPVVVIENYIQTPILMFNNGVTMSGVKDTQDVQLSGNLNIKGTLLVDGDIITKSTFRGYTFDSEIETVTDVEIDAGDY